MWHVAAAPYREMEVIGGNGKAGGTMSRFDDFLSSVTTILQNPPIVERHEATTHVLEPRSVYRRLPVHSTQLKVEGVVARDISSHFVRVRKN